MRDEMINKKSNLKIILASKSPRRIDILKNHGFDFIVDPADIDEKNFVADSVFELVDILAFEKAKKVASRYTDGIIIAADTLTVLDNKIIGKPKSKEDAFEILKNSSNNTHMVITGVVIWDVKSGKILHKSDTSYVTFKTMTDEDIHSYIETKEPFGKAGAFAIQGKGEKYIDHYKGSLTNIIGLPIDSVKEMLKELE
jgi:septum formation protein